MFNDHKIVKNILQNYKDITHNRMIDAYIPVQKVQSEQSLAYNKQMLIFYIILQYIYVIKHKRKIVLINVQRVMRFYCSIGYTRDGLNTTIYFS